MNQKPQSDFDSQAEESKRPDKFFYKFQHIRLVQRGLTFRENNLAGEILDKGFEEIDVGKSSVAELMQHLYKSGSFEKLFKIVVKFHEPNKAYRLWNRFWMKHYGFNSVSDVMQEMPQNEVEEIAGDFFILNPGWRMKLFALSALLASTSLTAVTGLTQQPLSAPTSWPGATSQKPN